MYPTLDFMLYQHSLKFTISLGSFKRRKAGLTGEVYNRHSVSTGLASADSGNHGWPVETNCTNPLYIKLEHAWILVSVGRWGFLEPIPCGY